MGWLGEYLSKIRKNIRIILIGKQNYKFSLTIINWLSLKDYKILFLFCLILFLLRILTRNNEKKLYHTPKKTLAYESLLEIRFYGFEI